MDAAVGAGMSGQFGFLVLAQTEPILFAVVAVAQGGATNGDAGQTESVIDCVLVVIVAAGPHVVNRGCFNGGGGIIKVIT